MNRLIQFIFLIFCTSSAFASEPKPWQLYFQPPATETMANIIALHDLLMYIITIIILFVLGLLMYVCYRFHHTRNPIPAKFTHNVVAEVTWTVLPVFILIIIAIPSFRLLAKENEKPVADLTIKVIGYQWFWKYEYPDNGGFGYDSVFLTDKQLKPGQKRLLDVDNRLVIPQGTTIRFVITGADVIHSFTVPSFGFKVDAVPGKISETYVKVDKVGVYYGQCSELCGVNHGFMPIAVEVVSKEDFAKWVVDAKAKFATSKLTTKIFASNNY